MTACLYLNCIVNHIDKKQSNNQQLYFSSHFFLMPTKKRLFQYQIILLMQMQELDNRLLIFSYGNYEKPYPDFQIAHMDMLSYLWTVIINFSIFFVIYKFKAFTTYIHAALGLFVGLATIITSIPILQRDGIPSTENIFYKQRHYIIGVVIIILIFIQLLLGIISKGLQLIKWSHPYLIYYMNTSHKYLGYVLMVLCKIQVFLKLDLREELESTFWGLLAAEIVMFIIWILCKVFFFKMEQIALPKYEEKYKRVQSLSAIQKQGHKAVAVFANYVYNMEPLFLHHPNGYRIIESVKEMDLDRFIYGSHSTDRFPKIPPISHSWKSLSLLDEPLAKIYIPALYDDLQQEMMEVDCASLHHIAKKGQIYQLKLKKKEGMFKYRGYVSLSQIGRYYALNADDKITRLYTSVAFLHPSNIDLLINQLEKGPFGQAIQTKSNNRDVAVPTSQRAISESNYISILFKYYAKGTMTNIITNKLFKSLKISEPRGQGLKFEELTPGKIIIVAGGTGLYPFSDLLNLLYLDFIINIENPSKAPLIEHLNPILKSNPFKSFSFHLILAVRHDYDIHPITQMQILELATRSPRFKLTLRLDNQVQIFKAEHPNIVFTNERFDKTLVGIMRAEPFSKVMICGPGIMTSAIVEQFDKNNIPRDQYLMV